MNEAPPPHKGEGLYRARYFKVATVTPSSPSP